MLEDAPSLLAMLTTEEVSRFISPPPTTVEGFERFIMWAQRERQAGNYACFAVVPDGMTTAVGIFQVRSLDSGFATAEWGFALGSQFWGTGIFAEGARLVVDFAVDVIGAHRLEARAAVANGRGNGALRKIGAVQEGVLRRSFRPQRRASRPGAVGHRRRGLAPAAPVAASRRPQRSTSAQLSSQLGLGLGHFPGVSEPFFCTAETLRIRADLDDARQTKAITLIRCGWRVADHRARSRR